MIEEVETKALRHFLAAHERDRMVTSALVRTELRRAVLRFSDRQDVDADQQLAAAREAEALLRRVDLVRVGAEVLDRAGHLPPPPLRSLDAIHLATALALGPRLDAVVVYDTLLAAAARDAGLHIEAPSPHP
ncbi:type II toxin-antitoxin system VapC family toxin [soil metagenome]